jgi:lysophospholipase L1-like esterase
MRIRALWVLGACAFLCPAGEVVAQDLGGVLFEDRDADGIRDPEEPAIGGVAVQVFGQTDSGGTVDQIVLTAGDGRYELSPGAGCYLLAPAAPEGWRLGPARSDTVVEGSSGYVAPVGLPRFSKLDQALDHLRAGALRYSALGDSIATNFNWCEFGNFFGSFNYSEDYRDRLQCIAPAATVTLDEDAIKGEHTDDLLVEDGGANNVFRVLSVAPELVSISMIGNDILDVDEENATQEQINVAIEELLDSRQNLQEALSSMLAEIPDLDITLNSLYDNLAEDCYLGTPTTSFHREWVPILNQMLRDLAWGQVRRVSVNEAAAELAIEDLSGNCSGFGEQICSASSDGIHPTQPGYDIIREKLWEASGGASLGPRDATSRDSITTADYGLLRRVRRLLPTEWEALGGAEVSSAESAFDDDDQGAAASIRLGLGSEEFRVRGFPDWMDEISIVKVIGGVRYRTTGSFQDDLYRIEASPGGIFRAPPGHDFSPTDWDFYTPIVGGGGPDAPSVKPDYPNARLLVRPEVADFREASATLTRNPVLDAGAASYRWPPLDHADLSTTEMRLVAAPVGATAGPDGRIEVDAMWLDLYGWEKQRPEEVTDVRLELRGDGALAISFDPLPSAERYNVYFGRTASARSGQYDHGGGAPTEPVCGATTESGGGGRLQVIIPSVEIPAGDVYAVVTAHVDDVESPSGFSSAGVEIDRSQSSCR